MSNIIKAFINIVNNYEINVQTLPQGNKNNPPDLILKNSDAIEIKKIEFKNSVIDL